MNNFKQKLVKAMMYVSLQEREKRWYAKYKKEREYYEQMADDMLTCMYIEVKSKLEQKTQMFSFLTIVILLAGLADIWEFFSKFILSFAASMASATTADFDVQKVGVCLFLIIFALAVIVGFAIILSSLDTIYNLHKRLLLIEDIREKRQAR